MEIDKKYLAYLAKEAVAEAMKPYLEIQGKMVERYHNLKDRVTALEPKGHQQTEEEFAEEIRNALEGYAPQESEFHGKASRY